MDDSRDALLWNLLTIGKSDKKLSHSRMAFTDAWHMLRRRYSPRGNSMSQCPEEQCLRLIFKTPGAQQQVASITGQGLRRYQALQTSSETAKLQVSNLNYDKPISAASFLSFRQESIRTSC